MERMTILEAKKLTKRYAGGEGEVLALREASLKLGAGESLAVSGPSGSGKSTLLSLLAGLEAPSSGQVWLEGRRLDGMPETELARLRGRRIGIVFQTFRLLPNLSALENVRVPLDLAGAPDAQARARGWLEKVGLAARAAHPPSRLSGGEQQRVALARALAPGPALVLADEPTGNLDSKNGAMVADLLFGLARGSGAALLLITHERRMAARADRVLVMKDGRLGRGRA